MKKDILMTCFLSLALTACQEDYNLNADFSLPTEFNSPSSILLDVTSTTPITLSWTGGGAADGGIVLYEVLFDKEDGDFSEPLSVMKSNQGAMPSLSITHAAINTIARKAGIRPDETGTLKWTVNASKGGVVKRAEQVSSFTVTRGEGIDNIPQELFLYGNATENSGQGGLAFRMVSEGIFQIYTTLSTGNIFFKSSTNADAFSFYISDNGKLKEGEMKTDIEGIDGVARITVDFNSLKMSLDEVQPTVRCIWGATYNDIAGLEYVGDGKFVGEGDIIFVDPSRPESNPPSWLGWTVERYYFIAVVNGTEVCWGRADDVSAERPVGGEPDSFYSLYEYPWSQWDHLWKMSGNLDYKHATVTIDTNKNGLMIHTFTNVVSIN